MIMKVTFTTKQSVPVRYLRAECGVRYWEDGKVDGVEDADGSLIPCRDGEYWRPLIDLETGQIMNWTPGVTANIHYKVCDDGKYVLLSENMSEVRTIDGYVPAMLSPKEDGFGDYVIMDVDAEGMIQNWKPDLRAFEKDDE
jgi:hypothetical protein